MYVGDTIGVTVEVIEQRPTSKGDRGLITTRNEVVNQRGEVVLVYTPVRLTRGANPCELVGPAPAHVSARRPLRSSPTVRRPASDLRRASAQRPVKMG